MNLLVILVFYGHKNYFWTTKNLKIDLKTVIILIFHFLDRKKYVSISLLPCALQHLLHIRFISRCILLMFVQGSKRWYMHLSDSFRTVKFRLNENRNRNLIFIILTKTKHRLEYNIMELYYNESIIMKFISNINFFFVDDIYGNSWLYSVYNKIFL